MLTSKKNARKVDSKRCPKLLNELYFNGWYDDEYIVTFGESEFDVDHFMEYIPENGVQLDTMKKSRKELRALAETLDGEYPVVFVGGHRAAMLNVIELITGKGMKFKSRKAGSLEEAEKAEYTSNKKHKYAVKLQYADDFKQVVKGYGNTFQKEAQLGSIWPGDTGRGQRQRAWLAARLMDEQGLSFEQAAAITSWASGKQIEKDLKAGNDLETVIAGATAKVNNNKIMTGKDVRELLAHAEEEEVESIIKVLQAIVKNEPTTLRGIINVNGKTAKARAKAKGEAETRELEPSA